MTFIQFPLRLQAGLLKRCQEPEAILALLGIMGRTPSGSWSGSENFGLRDFLERARAQPELLPRAVEAINLALLDLGVTTYRVSSMTPEGPANRDEDSYVVTLVSSLDPSKTVSAQLG